jgi:hypothetical protein
MRLTRLSRDESGQGTLEYILVLGAFTVALAAALLVGAQFIVPGVLRAVCTTVDPVLYAQTGSCLWW